MSNNILQTRQVEDPSNTSLVTLLANVNTTANAAANTVKVMANSGSILNSKSLNFVNTAQIAVTVTDNGDGNANISFATGGISANAANTVKVMANSAGILAPRSLNFVNTNTSIVSVVDNGDGNANISFLDKVSITIPLSDLVTPLTSVANVAYVRSPRPFTLVTPRASLLTPSNTGAVNVQVTMNGTNVFSTLLTIDNASYTSVGSNVTPVIANTTILDDANLKYSIISAGGNAIGLIVTLTGISV